MATATCPPGKRKYRNTGMPRAVNKQVGMQRALELRMTKTPDGGCWTYARIGEELGISEYLAARWVVEALTQIKYDNRERAFELRAINTQRLEIAIEKVLAKINDGSAVPADYNSLIRLIQTENKLWGLDEPSSLEVTVKVEDMTTSEKLSRISELMEMAYSHHSALANGMPRDNTPPVWRVSDTQPDIIDAEPVAIAAPQDNGNGRSDS